MFARQGYPDVDSWQQVSARARRRTTYFDGKSTLAVYIASRSDIEDIVPSSLSGPSSLIYIVFLQGFGEKPRLQRISASNALFKLFSYSFNPDDNCPRLLYTYAPLIDSVDCYNLVVGDLGATAEIIRQNLFEDRGPAGGLTA